MPPLPVPPIARSETIAGPSRAAGAGWPVRRPAAPALPKRGGGGESGGAAASSRPGEARAALAAVKGGGDSGDGSRVDDAAPTTECGGGGLIMAAVTVGAKGVGPPRADRASLRPCRVTTVGIDSP